MIDLGYLVSPVACLTPVAVVVSASAAHGSRFSIRRKGSMLQRKTTPFDWFKRSLVAVGCVLAPGIVHAVSLSGTVQYTGAQGPVSNTRPILMLLSTTPSPTSNPVAQIAVTANGPFDLEAPTAGQYYLGYLLDSNGDGRASVGEPYQVFRNRLNFPGDPIMVPQAGVALSFDDTAALSGIAGTVTYTGTQGPVSNQQRLIVQAFRDAALTDEATDSEHQKTNGSRYDLVTLDTNTYYVRAFLDVNGNRHFESGEPFTVYNHRGMPPFDPVGAGPHQTEIDITFGDENLGGTPTPTPTPVPTPSACAGDCDASGAVTVNNIITLVDIAIGGAEPSACPDGIPTGAEVSVAVIIQAVNNALSGCPNATPPAQRTEQLTVGPSVWCQTPQTSLVCLSPVVEGGRQVGQISFSVIRGVASFTTGYISFYTTHGNQTLVATNWTGTQTAGVYSGTFSGTAASGTPFSGIVSFTTTSYTHKEGGGRVGVRTVTSYTVTGGSGALTE